MSGFLSCLLCRQSRVMIAWLLLALMLPSYSCGSQQPLSVSKIRLGKILGIIQLVTSIANPLEVLTPDKFEAELKTAEGVLISTITSANISIDSDLKLRFVFEGVESGTYKVVLYYKLSGGERNAILTKTVLLDNGVAVSGGGGFGCGGGSSGTEETGSSVTVQDEVQID